MTDNPIWVRLNTDTDKSYEAFCIYRDLGAQRSLEKAWKQYQGRTNTVSGYFRDWSVTHNWQERVSAYDDYQRDLKRQRVEQKRIEIEFDALSDYDAIRKAIDKRIKLLEDVDYKSPPSDLHDLINLMQHVNAYARLNSGMPDKISQSTNTNNNTHSGSLTLLSNLSDDELDSIIGDDD